MIALSTTIRRQPVLGSLYAQRLHFHFKLRPLLISLSEWQALKQTSTCSRPAGMCLDNHVSIQSNRRSNQGIKTQGTCSCKLMDFGRATATWNILTTQCQHMFEKPSEPSTTSLEWKLPHAKTRSFGLVDPSILIDWPILSCAILEIQVKLPMLANDPLDSLLALLASTKLRKLQSNEIQTWK